MWSMRSAGGGSIIHIFYLGIRRNTTVMQIFFFHVMAQKYTQIAKEVLCGMAPCRIMYYEIRNIQGTSKRYLVALVNVPVTLNNSLSHYVRKSCFCIVRFCRLGGSPTTRPAFAVCSADGVWRRSPSPQTQTTGFTVSTTTTGEFLMQAANRYNNNGPGLLIHTLDKGRNQTQADGPNMRRPLWVLHIWVSVTFSVVSGSEPLCVLHVECRYCQLKWAQFIV